jgi:drug/metabolite transporter (DMT)-like permease
VIPITIGVLFYKESPGFLKISGILLAIIAFYFTLGGGIKRGVVKNTYWYLPLLLFFGNGINDSLMKHVETSFLSGSSMLLISCVFTVALIVGIFFSIVSYKRNPEPWKAKNLVGGVLLGVLNLSSTFYFFESIATYSNTVFFPVFNVSIVALSAIMGVVLFKETLSPGKRLGIAFALLSIVLIAFSR